MNSQTEWIYAIYHDIAARANAQYFHFDLTGNIIDRLQYCDYQKGQHFDAFHMDRHSPGTLLEGVRKLTLVLSLDGPDAYTGGGLEVFAGGEPQVMTPARGEIVIFPSFLLHRAPKIKSGHRRSLVLWVPGPPFQ
jgi:PKHD-type hydroxylase